MPVAEIDVSVVAPACDADRAAFLLPAIDVIGKGIVGGDVVELRCGLVVPGRPGLSAIDRGDGALIARQ